MKPDLVLIHGWGVHSGIWNPILHRLELDFEITLIDLPGYGTNANSPSDHSLESVARTVLALAPPQAIWVGWSLGGTIAMEAAIQQPERIAKMQLISSTPRFLNGDDWDRGVAADAFHQLAQQFERDYTRGLKKFLLLQASPSATGNPTSTRDFIRATIQSLSSLPNPSSETLNAGLTILNDTDLRPKLSSIAIETQIIAGTFDSVVPAAASEFLARNLPVSDYHKLPSGHLPFLDAPDHYFQHLKSLAGIAT